MAYHPTNDGVGEFVDGKLNLRLRIILLHVF